MLTIARKRVSRLVPLLIATAVVCIGAYFVSTSAIADMQRSHGEYIGQSFGKYLVQQVPDLAGIVEGAAASQPALDAFAVLKPIGSVFKFQVFDINGTLRIDASAFATAHVVKARDSFVNVAAQRVVANGRPTFELRTGDGRMMPAYYSEI